ncbi:MAG: hypothetical protein ACRBBW_06065 [Cellvibrionaceae bacterium]
MINLGPVVPNSSSYKASKTSKTGQLAAHSSENTKNLPDNSQYLISDRRFLRDRRDRGDGQKPMLELRSGRDRRRGTSLKHVDLTV